MLTKINENSVELRLVKLDCPSCFVHFVLVPADVLKELVLLSPHDFLHTLVPFLQHNHCTYHHSNIPSESPPPLLHHLDSFTQLSDFLTDLIASQIADCADTVMMCVHVR